MLSRALGAHVIGVTISPVQIEIGNSLIARAKADIDLVQMDAEALALDDRFDLVWSVEALSHVSKKEDCFHAIARLLNREGKLVIAYWFKSGTATAAQARKLLEPIERAMVVAKLEVPSSYASYIRDAGLRVLSFDDLSEKVRKTWDLATELVRAPTLWKLAARRGEDFSAFLQAFAAMRAGYQSKALCYGALIAQKP